MVAPRRELTPDTTVAQLNYWRGIRLDFPARKIEALRHIDNLLDEILEEKANGTGGR